MNTSLGQTPAGGASRRLLSVVAIENYNDDKLWDKIPTAESGAGELSDLFQRQFGFTTLEDVRGSKATRRAIMDSLARIEHDAGKDDQFVYYFAGHGITKGSGSGAKGFLVPADAPSEEASGEDQLISMAKLLDRLSRLKAKQVLVILDSCHSGLAVPPHKAEDSGKAADSDTPIDKAKVRIVLMSAARNQRAIAQGNKAPLFTSVLLEVLRKNSCDFSGAGYCNAVELAMLSRRLVVEESRKRDSPQTPVFERFEGDEEGEFRLNLTGTETDEWLRAANPSNPEKIKTYITTHPTGLYLAQARILQRQLQRQQMEAGNLVEIDDFRDFFGTQPGERAKSGKKDGLIYVWAPLKPQETPGSASGQSENKTGGLGGFWIGQTEVTVGAYQAFFRTAMPRSPAFNRGWKDPKQPIVNVSFRDAAAFCGLAGGRLPKPMEWEYAARAGKEYEAGSGKPIQYPWTSNEAHADLARVADKDKFSRPSTVGTFFPVSVNDWQMYDVIGNVAEWTDNVDPKGARTSIEIRGGSFADNLKTINLTKPQKAEPAGGNTIGFRCLIDPRPEIGPESGKALKAGN